MNIKPFLIKIHRNLSQFGLDPLKFILALRRLPAYIKDYARFRSEYDGGLEITPCLHDRHAAGGVVRSEYFWQDLVVAQWIYKANPSRHVDIGSRMDGFVAHVASFRQIEVFDVRPISLCIPGVVFRQADVMDDECMMQWIKEDGYCDSLSCLHVIEHFGLGRYGDPISVAGYRAGFANMISLLKPGGLFYLSTPVGKPRVEFNANWVFDPRLIIDLGRIHKLDLINMAVYVDGKGLLEVKPSDPCLDSIVNEQYTLAIFVFKRPN